MIELIYDSNTPEKMFITLDLLGLVLFIQHSCRRYLIVGFITKTTFLNKLPCAISTFKSSRNRMACLFNQSDTSDNLLVKTAPNLSIIEIAYFLNRFLSYLSIIEIAYLANRFLSIFRFPSFAKGRLFGFP